MVCSLVLLGVNIALDWFVREHRGWLEIASLALFAINMRLFLTMPNPPGGLRQSESQTLGLS